MVNPVTMVSQSTLSIVINRENDDGTETVVVVTNEDVINEYGGDDGGDGEGGYINPFDDFTLSRVRSSTIRNDSRNHMTF